MAAPERYDLAGTLGALAMIGKAAGLSEAGGDPSTRVGGAQAWWATRTPDGPGRLHLVRDGSQLSATGYGAGARWLVDRADAIAGLRDDLGGFAEVVAGDELLRQLTRVHSGLRMPATGRVFHHLVPAILGQKVTGKEAHHA